MKKVTNWPNLIRAVMERLKLTRKTFGERVGASGKPSVDKWLQPAWDPPVNVQRSIESALDSLGDGFCDEAVDQFCLGRAGLGSIVRHIKECSKCGLAERRIRSASGE